MPAGCTATSHEVDAPGLPHDDNAELLVIEATVALVG